MIDDLIGIPFVGGGRNPKTGLDCYGLVREVYRRYGIELPEYDNAVKEWGNEHKCNEFYNKCKDRYWQEVKTPSVPCLIAFSFSVPRGTVNHCGVYIGNGKFIHTRNKVGSCIESINSPLWRRMIEGYYVSKTNTD